MRSLTEISDSLAMMDLELRLLRQQLAAVLPSVDSVSGLPQAFAEAPLRLVVVDPSLPPQPLSEAVPVQKPDCRARLAHPSGQKPVLTSALTSSKYLPYNHSRALICACKAIFKTIKIGLALCLAWIVLFGQPIKLWEALVILLKAMFGVPQ